MALTEDPNDPRLGYGVDEEPVDQNEAYLVATQGPRIRPLWFSYVHSEDLGGCGVETFMHRDIAETYARNPRFYGATYCVGCRKHLPVGERGQFRWPDGSRVGT